MAWVTAVTILALWVAAPRPVELTLLGAVGAVAALAIALGLAAAGRFGRGAMIDGAAAVRPRDRGEAAGRLAGSGLLGFVLGVIILGVLIFALVPLEPALAARLQTRAGDPAWMPVALAFESSVLEEVVFRLFLLSGLVWLLGCGWRRDVTEPAPIVVWSGILVSSAAFGLAHLPSWLGVVQATPLLVGSVLVLNGLAGVALGRMYWRWGLEAAVVCHFAADLAVQGIGPYIVRPM
jgi:membrane protease YdiL (CAAX protease family)